MKPFHQFILRVSILMVPCMIGVNILLLAQEQISMNQRSRLIQDTLEARRLTNKAEISLKAKDYEQALGNFRSAAKTYLGYANNSQDTALWKLYFYCSLQEVNCLENLRKYQQSLRQRLSILKLAERVYGADHPLLTGYYWTLGRLHRTMGSYDQAIDAQLKALELSTDDDNELQELAIYNDLGIIYSEQGQYDKALQYHLEVVEIINSKYDDNHPKFAIQYNNIGEILRKKGAYEAALECYQKTLMIDLQTLGKSHPDLAGTYNNIGIVHRNQGAFATALEHYRKALKMWTETLGKDHPAVAISHHNMGNLYNDQANYTKAIDHYQKALTIRTKAFGEYHPRVAGTYNNLANAYRDQGNASAAISLYQKALSIRKQVFGKKNPDVASTYSNLGKAYSDQKNYPEALSNYQQALVSNVIEFNNGDPKMNPALNTRVLSSLKLIKTLRRKGTTLYAYYSSTKEDISLLQLSYQTYRKALQFVDAFKKQLKRDEDKTEFVEDAFQTYEGAIRTTMALYRHTLQDSLLQFAFQVMEGSRSLLLLENLQRQSATNIAGISEDIVVKEQEIITDLAFYQKSLYEESLKQVGQDSTRITLWKNKIFALQQSMDSLSSVLETDFPDYFTLKYENAGVPVEEIRDITAQGGKAFIEYFVGDNSIYILYVTAGTNQLIEVAKDFPLEEWIQQLRNSIYGYQLASAKTESLYQDYLDTLKELSYRLYTKLLKPIADQYQLPQRLVICPSDVLSYLPFELLLKEQATADQLLKDYSYLLRDHQISYVLSAAIWQKTLDGRTKHRAQRLLAIAPEFKNSGNTTSIAAMAELRGSNLHPLVYNSLEAERIHRYYGGKILDGKQATKENFQQEAAKYDLIHLATHGKANDQMGDYSFLAFASHADSLTHEKLYNRELYNLTLNSEMVVLSACETGIGELQKGEGIISLARGFSYAGSKSIITSLWSVNDKSTAEIMELFYKNLRTGMSKDAALQQAKLAYLDDQVDPMDQHPFYWAAFVPMGDMAPLSEQRRFSLTWLSAIAIVVLFGWILSRKRERKEFS